MKFVRASIISAFLALVWYPNTGWCQTNLESPHATVSLIQRGPCYADKPCEFGFLFKLDPQWHVYWRNPGDSGAPPKFKFIEPSNFSNRPDGHDVIDWPVPKRLPLGHLMNYGYEDQVLLGFTVPAEKNRTTINLFVEAEWLVCHEDCVPGSGTFSLTAPVLSLPTSGISALPDIAGNNDEVFKNRNLPDTLSLHGTAVIQDKNLVLQLSSDIPDINEIFPETGGILFNKTSNPSFQRNTDPRGNVLEISIPTKVETIFQPIVFLLKHGTHGTRVIFDPKNVPPMHAASDDGSVTFLILSFFSAFLGGLLLNLMPCVFPVLGLKVLSAVQSAKDSIKDRIIIASSFLLGVLTLLWVLYGLIYLAKSYGEVIGWGFQLQNPSIVFLLALLFIAIGAHLLGWFDIGTSLQNRLSNIYGTSLYTEHFLSGLLTVIVATPCTAPFMGAAIGAAVAASVWVGLLIFSGLGIGIAAPFCLLVITPQLGRYLPKPGKWTDTLKKLLSIPCFVTAMWLGWVFYSQEGAAPRTASFTDEFGLMWTPYSEAALESAQTQGETVLLDFTAAWCISCQVNRQVVFSSPDVQSVIKDKHIVLMIADWTNKDEKIARALQSFGKAGVPLNVLYTPRQPPYQFPSVLTPGMVVAKLKE